MGALRMETFVVQIWASADETGAAAGGLPGFVEHVDSGRREAFREAGELLAFLRRVVRPAASEGSNGASLGDAPSASRLLHDGNTGS